MKAKVILTSVFFLFVFLTVLNGQSGNAKVSGTDYESLSQKIVNQCAAIKEGDLVLITGGFKDIELLEDIVVNVCKKGAYPLLSISSDRINKRFLMEVPPRYDSSRPEMLMKLYGFIDAMISVDYSEVPDLYADIPSERIVTISNAFAPANELFLKRNIRGVFLGNGLNPTPARAKQFNMSIEELSKIYWDGVNVDYTKLEQTGKSISELFEKGREVQVTNPNGTDIKVDIENRKVFVSDGIVSQNDIISGPSACQVYLPAGEVYLSVVPGTAEGKVVVDHYFFMGKDIQDMTLIFKAGKLVSMTAKSGLDPMKKLYDASGNGKEDFSFIDIGINPNVKPIPGSNFASWVTSGMVTLGHGNNEWAGGENKSTFNGSYFLPGSTLKIDGKVLIENGVLKY